VLQKEKNPGSYGAYIWFSFDFLWKHPKVVLLNATTPDKGVTREAMFFYVTSSGHLVETWSKGNQSSLANDLFCEDVLG